MINAKIESIEFNINDILIMYLNNKGEPSPDNGGGSPSYLLSRRRLRYKYCELFYVV